MGRAPVIGNIFGNPLVFEGDGDTLGHSESTSLTKAGRAQRQGLFSFPVERCALLVSGGCPGRDTKGMKLHRGNRTSLSLRCQMGDECEGCNEGFVLGVEQVLRGME